MFMVHLQVQQKVSRQNRQRLYYENETKVFESLVLSNTPLFWVVNLGTE